MVTTNIKMIDGVVGIETTVRADAVYVRYIIIGERVVGNGKEVHTSSGIGSHY